MPSIIYGMQQLAENVQGIRVPNSGHFIAEEQPDVVVKLLNNFFSGNSTTKTSKWGFPIILQLYYQRHVSNLILVRYSHVNVNKKRRSNQYMVSTRFSNTNNDDAQMDSLVTSITFVVIAFHLQISEEYNYYILALAYLF